jgi:hypothetical protein
MIDYQPSTKGAVIMMFIGVLLLMASFLLLINNPLETFEQSYLPLTVFALGLGSLCFSFLMLWNWWAWNTNARMDQERHSLNQTPALLLAREVRGMTPEMLERMPLGKDGYGSLFYGPDGHDKAPLYVNTPFGPVPYDYLYDYLERSNILYGLPVKENTTDSDGTRDQKRDWQVCLEELFVYKTMMHPIDRQHKKYRGGPYVRAQWKTGGYGRAIHYWHFDDDEVLGKRVKPPEEQTAEEALMESEV